MHWTYSYSGYKIMACKVNLLQSNIIFEVQDDKDGRWENERSFILHTVATEHISVSAKRQNQKLDREIGSLSLPKDLGGK